MSMSNKLPILVLVVAAAAGQNALNSRSNMHITLPEDAPLAVVSADWGESALTPRGSAMLLDLHTSLTLRNVGNRRVRGVTLLVMAQEAAPGGKASVSVPSLGVGPGEVFPVRLDLRLLRPNTDKDGPLVEVSLDGVLFDDLSFYGPNRLNSRRQMMLWEMEARRDRQYLKRFYETNGVEALRQQMVNVQARLSERSRMDIQLARGRTTNAEGEHAVQFAFLRLPGEPVTPSPATGMVSSAEARIPQVDVTNRANRQVRFVELGWLLTDAQGQEFYAGSLPADVDLAPGARTRLQPDMRLKLGPRDGKPVQIAAMRGFVNHVEFADGSVWIPDRGALAAVKSAIQPSHEEQRLSNLYRRKGIQSVIEELVKP